MDNKVLVVDDEEGNAREQLGQRERSGHQQVDGHVGCLLEPAAF